MLLEVLEVLLEVLVRGSEGALKGLLKVLISRLGSERCSVFRKQCSMFDVMFDVQDHQNHSRDYQDHPSGCLLYTSPSPRDS